MAQSVTIRVEKFEGSNITYDMLKEGAKLFSKHYGIWNSEAAIHMGPFAKAGARVQINARRLQEQCLPEAARNSLVRIFVDDKLVGNVFAARWTFEGRSICWITQLVVDAHYRRQGLATRLLGELRRGEHDYGYGVLSSHPAAIYAALRAFGREPGNVDHEIAREQGRAIIAVSPVDYVRNAKLRGSVFGTTDDGTVSCANTGFFIDHQEILDALAVVKANGRQWPLGELPEGHEFLLMVRGDASDTESYTSRNDGVK